MTAADVPDGGLCKLPCGCVLEANDVHWEPSDENYARALQQHDLRTFDLVTACDHETMAAAGYCELYPVEKSSGLVTLAVTYPIIADMFVNALHVKFGHGRRNR